MHQELEGYNLIEKDSQILELDTNHPPGAAHRSSKARDFGRNWNLRFNWINLKEERERNPGKERSTSGTIPAIAMRLKLYPSNLKSEL